MFIREVNAIISPLLNLEQIQRRSLVVPIRRVLSAGYNLTFLAGVALMGLYMRTTSYSAEENGHNNDGDRPVDPEWYSRRV